MKVKTALALLTATLLLIACSDENAPPSPAIPFENSNLEVTVLLETDTGLVKAAGTQVILYEKEEHRRDDIKRVYEGHTNAEGKVTFTAMAKAEYWILVKAPDGELKFFAEDGTAQRTPGHPIALNKLEVVFRK